MEDLHVQMEDISKAKQAVSAPPALLFPSLQAAVSVATRSRSFLWNFSSPAAFRGKRLGGSNDPI